MRRFYLAAPACLTSVPVTSIFYISQVPWGTVTEFVLEKQEEQNLGPRLASQMPWFYSLDNDSLGWLLPRNGEHSGKWDKETTFRQHWSGEQGAWITALIRALKCVLGRGRKDFPKKGSLEPGFEGSIGVQQVRLGKINRVSKAGRSEIAGCIWVRDSVRLTWRLCGEWAEGWIMNFLREWNKEHGFDL